MIEQMRLHSFKLKMLCHRVTLVTPGRQHDGGPKIPHRREMQAPVAAGDRSLKDRCKLWIHADPSIKLIHKRFDSGLGYVFKLGDRTGSRSEVACCHYPPPSFDYERATKGQTSPTP